MNQPPLSPTNDFVFKKVFGENMRVLANFLKSVLDLPPEDYQGMIVVNPYLSRYSLEDKYGILDIKLRTHNQKTINVEVQVRPQQSIWKRMQYYMAKMLVEQISKGSRYDSLTRSIGILITDFVLVKENDEYHNRFRLFDEKTLARYPDSIEINTLEIPKVREDDGTKLNDWMKFFAAKTEEQFMTIAEKNPAIAEAWGIVKTLSADEETRQLIEYREKARMDYEDNYDGAYMEGKEEGAEKEKEEVAKNALRENMPPELIAKITGLSIGDIEKLASES